MAGVAPCFGSGGSAGAEAFCVSKESLSKGEDTLDGGPTDLLRLLEVPRGRSTFLPSTDRRRGRPGRSGVTSSSGRFCFWPNLSGDDRRDLDEGGDGGEWSLERDPRCGESLGGGDGVRDRDDEIQDLRANVASRSMAGMDRTLTGRVVICGKPLEFGLIATSESSLFGFSIRVPLAFCDGGDSASSLYCCRRDSGALLLFLEMRDTRRRSSLRPVGALLSLFTDASFPF